MKVLLTGACGFVGSTIASELASTHPQIEIIGLDNLSRPGSERNRHALKRYGVRLQHGDIRNWSDLEALPAVDWVIDAAANPSVLAGVSGPTSSRQLVEHNLLGTINLLERCKAARSGFIMLSTSRVYSAAQLARIRVEVADHAFVPIADALSEPGVRATGITEEFSTTPPLSLYGTSKLASEVLAMEYGIAFDFPVFVNRCGALAGAGQFGKADQGVLSFWIHSYCQRRPLTYIGFGGTGHQVRDYLHPRDVASLVVKQIASPARDAVGLGNVAGGLPNSLSLAQLSRWCEERFGPHPVDRELGERPYDAPWIVLDSTRVRERWNWNPGTTLEAILEEIARHAEKHPDWLDLAADP
jgi:CDP-paratose 2-epimerase